MINLKQVKNIIIFGFTISVLSILFWHKFIKLRIPRDIPFNLHLITLITISSILTMYIIAIYWSFIKNRKENKEIPLYNIIYKPLYFLDDNIKYYIKLDPLLLYFVNNSTSLTCIYDVIVMIKCVPRFILSSLFFLDVFFIKQIYYTYKGIWLLIFSLILEYILYSLRRKKKCIITEMEEKIDLYYGDIAGPLMPIEIFIELQAATLLKKQPALPYDILLTFDYTVKLRQDLDKIQKGRRIKTQPIYAEQQKLLTECLNIAQFLQLIQTQERKSWLILFILRILYILSWSYILFVSWPYFHLLPLELSFINNFQTIIEPFSDTEIF